nr:hypothetical protein BaRGS_006160 [Batillaria attramentaria]
MTSEQLIYVDVSTMSRHSASFNLSAELLEDFQLRPDVPHNVRVSPSEPQYFMYEFPEGVETVLLRVTSEDKLCTVVSVQQIKCPIFDLDRNIAYEGKHQTMTTQASIFLQRSDYADFDAFYVVIFVKPNNADCSVPDEIQPAGKATKKYKNLSISITPSLPSSQYYVAIFATLAVFLSFYVVAAIIGCIYHGCGCHRSVNDLTDAERDQLLCFNHGNLGRSQSGCSSEIQSPVSSGGLSDDSTSLLRSTGLSGYGATDNDGSPPQRSRELRSIDVSRNSSASRENSDLDIDTSDIDFLPDADLEKEVVRTKTMLFVSDLSRKSHKKLSKTFKIYHWNLLTIAIFYGLPVAQLVLTYQQVLLRTGDQDLCYYNFACAHPISRISAFNNVISNMGYVLLGLLFVILVWRRDLLHRTLLKENPQLERRYGIPQHYGLLYSMGVALVMEGIMSACYHVCPNYSNFQFDTSFMYIIACLCMLKIYETRHPDVQAKAYKSYFSMAMIIFIAVLGVIYGTNIFWIFYALIHMFSTLVLSVNIYYVGRINLDRYVFKRMAQLIISECFNCVRPIYPGRFVMLLLGNLINWAL